MFFTSVIYVKFLLNVIVYDLLETNDILISSIHAQISVLHKVYVTGLVILLSQFKKKKE